MYKIIGSDGKEYGPATLDQLKQWIQEGRINAQTRLQQVGETGWKRAAEFPELAPLLPPLVTPASTGASAPPPLTPQAGPQQQSGLAITSFVLGLLSMLCFGLLTGIPAIICGHLAHKRARQLPDRFGGAGFAMAGFVMGYVSVAITLLAIALLAPALTTARSKAESINCMNNMKQIGLAFRVWALDHGDQFPSNVSTNSGGTQELRDIGPDGFDRDPATHFSTLSNELSTPKILWCPADKGKSAAIDFSSLENENISYRLRTGEEVGETNPGEILAICPIHNNVVHCDGSVQHEGMPGPKKPRKLGGGSKSKN